MDRVATVIVVRCHTCEERLGVVGDVYAAEHLRWKHDDEHPTHETTWWTTTARMAGVGVA